MKNIFLSLIWMAVAAMPTLNAQQASPSQNAATQPTSKPKASQAFPQPRGQPTQATTANNNLGRDKGIANNPGHRKPAANNPGNGKITDTTLAVGKQLTTMATVTRTPCVATIMNGTTTIGGNNTTSLSCWSEADTIIGTRDIGIRLGDTIPTMSATITTDRFTPMAIYCRTRSSSTCRTRSKSLATTLETSTVPWELTLVAP